MDNYMSGNGDKKEVKVMCIAVPGIVIKIEGSIAWVDYSGNVIEAKCGLVPIQIGDRVLVHAGCILQKMTSFEHQQLLELLDEIEALDTI